MREPEPVLPDVVEQSGCHCRLQVVEQVEFVPVGRCCRDPKFELEPDHRHDAKRLLHLVVEARESTTNRALHVDRAVGSVHGLEKERVPGGLAHDLVEIDLVADQFQCLVIAQTLEAENGGRGSAEARCDQVGHTSVDVRGRVARRQHERHRAASLSALKMGEKLECRVGRPVNVVDDHGDGGVRREFNEPVCDRLEHPISPGLAVERRLCLPLEFRCGRGDL